MEDEQQLEVGMLPGYFFLSPGRPAFFYISYFLCISKRLLD
jgi:hypothetical protein